MAAGVLVGTLGLIWLVRELGGLISTLVMSLFVAFALEPAVNRMAKRGWRRGAATIVVLLTLVALCVVVVASMVPLLVDEVRGLLRSLPGWLQSISGYTERWFGISVTPGESGQAALTDVGASLSSYVDELSSGVLGAGSRVISAIFKIFSILLFSYYLVADGPRLRRSVCSLLPPARQRRVLWIWELAISKTGGYLYSRLLLAALSATYTFMVLLLLGVPYPVPLALWMGIVSQFVPVVGTYVAMLLPLLVAVLEVPASSVWVLVLLVAYQQVENYLISPRVTARTMSVHPAVAFGAAVAGATLAGAVGAFLALPVVAIAQAALSVSLPRNQVIDSDLTAVAPESTWAASRVGSGRQSGRRATEAATTVDVRPGPARPPAGSA